MILRLGSLVFAGDLEAPSQQVLYVRSFCEIGCTGISAMKWDSNRLVLAYDSSTTPVGMGLRVDPLMERTEPEEESRPERFVKYFLEIVGEERETDRRTDIVRDRKTGNEREREKEREIVERCLP